MALTSRRRELNVVLQLLDQPAELLQQSRILVQFLSPCHFGCRGYRSDLGFTGCRGEKDRGYGERALYETIPSLLKSSRESHAVLLPSKIVHDRILVTLLG